MGETGRRVAVLTASYNTRELTAMLLWSLCRVLARRPELIMVVDNGSTDGSVELLAGAERAGLCQLVRNASNLGHGPALNQGMELLRGGGTEWVWILDSDCVVARPDALDAVDSAARASEPAIIGEAHWDRWLRRRRFGLYSLILDVRRLSEWELPGFTDGGDPSIELLDAAGRAGLRSLEFPFGADGHVIHLGRGSLAGVAERNETAHPLYAWARDHREPHYGGVPGAAARYQDLLGRFRDDGGSELDLLVDALNRP